MAVLTGFEPAIFCVTGRRDKPLHYRTMVAEEGFEPTTSGLWAQRATSCSTPRYKWRRKQDSNPRALSRLSVFKTDPFSRTWVFLRLYLLKILNSKMVDPAGLEPATARLWAGCSDQLSYGSIKSIMVAVEGFEPPTFRVWTERSSQLSYTAV